MTRIILRLYSIHIFAWLAIWLAMFWPGVDLILSIIYLVIVAAEFRSWGRHSKGLGWGSFFIWQAPGFVFALASLTPWSWWGLKEYAFFLLEFWYTPVVPLLSLLNWAIAGYPLYYYALLATPLLFAIFFMVIVLSKKSAPRSSRIRYT
ncbi:MAG: hypothetical protein ACOXZ6_12065 [Syntrophomonadaceae bacterium]|jgi:hypothetical protein|nr:hypothetical protein [Bacillota bacterium]NLP24311.1 hypothetical protein [Syntrophomonadaceae bacterium]